MGKGNKQRSKGNQERGRNLERYDEYVPQVKLTEEEQKARIERALALLDSQEETERATVIALSELKISKNYWGRMLPEVVQGVNDFTDANDDSEKEGMRQPAMKYMLTKLHRAFNNRLKVLNFVTKNLINGDEIEAIISTADEKLSEMSNTSQEERDTNAIRQFNEVRTTKFLSEQALALAKNTGVSVLLASHKMIDLFNTINMKMIMIIENAIINNHKVAEVGNVVEREIKQANTSFMKGLDRLNIILESKGEERITYF